MARAPISPIAGLRVRGEPVSSNGSRNRLSNGNGRPPAFDPRRVLRRTGFDARELRGELAGDIGRFGRGIGSRLRLDSAGALLITAGVGLLGLILLDLALSGRGAAGVSRILEGTRTAIQALLDPTDTFFERGEKSTVARDGALRGSAPPAARLASVQTRPGVGGKVFPIAGGASFTNDFNAARADTGTHGGIDVFAARGTPLVAIDDGVLERVGFNRLGGNRLWIRTPSGEGWYYAHLDRFAPGIRDGVHVKAGDVVGFVGTTGNAQGTPPHLHIGRTIGRALVWVNPFSILDALN